MRHFLAMALSATFLAALLSVAQAQDIAAGEKLARGQCSGCHYVGKNQKPPFGFAPAFSKIARTPGMTQTSIQVFLSNEHEAMPNYILSAKEIRDVAAYIETLR